MDLTVTPSSPWPRIAAMISRYPSPHNTQPLHLRIDDHHGATVLFDRACALPVHPLGVVFGHVTLGIYLESASIAAHSLGYGLEVTLTSGPVVPLPSGVDAALPGVPVGPDSDRLQPLARLLLQPVGAAVVGLNAELLQRRRTSRLPFDGRDLPAGVLAELAAECDAAGHSFATSAQRHAVREVVDLNQQALFDDLATPAMRAELQAWMRWSRRSAVERADGFSPECLVTPGPLLRSVFERPRLWSASPLRALSRAVYLRSMRGTPRIAWVRGPITTTQDAVAAGRLLIRLWLRLAGHGVAVHPFGSVVTNDTALASFDRTLGTVLSPTADGEGQTGPPLPQTWMILRLGYSDVPPVSLRRPLHRQVHQAVRADKWVR